jgi:DNA-binding CsgD family transcriptional regulator
VLLGRGRECQALDRLLRAVRAGESRALVVRGEPGVGKSALLDYAAERSSGSRVARAAGVESEMELAFAGLHQLCAPLLGRLDRLPPPQRDALATAFGLRAGAAPDRFLIGLAVLTLMSDVAEGRPLVCLVDDAHWLDRASAQTLAFVARRLQAESVGLLFAARSEPEVTELAGVPALVVEGLSDADARALLAAALPGTLDDGVRDRVIAEAHGNALALLELPRSATPAQLAGGYGVPAVPRRVEDAFRRRVDPLPVDARRLLLLAAAEPVGDPLLVWRAAERLGIDVDAARPATADGLVELGTGVRFRHPLVRSAIYGAASPADRRAAHEALAAVTDPEADPDRRAWHRAQAAAGPDDDVAEELVRSADRAQARGGFAAAAAFLERATALTLDQEHRAQRALAAAQAMHEAGDFEAALALLAGIDAGSLDELGRVRVDRLRGRIAFGRRRASDAAPLLLRAARRLEPLDAELARETYLEAVATAMFSVRLDSHSDMRGVAEAARAALPPAGAPRPADLALDALTALLTQGHRAAGPAMKRAVGAFREPSITREEELRWLWVACRMAKDLWDDEGWEALSTRQLHLARDAGALALLPIALMSQIALRLETGGLAAAASLVEEQDAVTEATGTGLPGYGVMMAALRGDAAETSSLIEATRRDVLARGLETPPAIVDTAAALLANGLGRYGDALAAARRATAGQVDVPTVALIELVEAGVRSGAREEAAGALGRLAETTRAGGTEWALGVEARCRALLSDGETAERLHREAIDRLGHTHVRVPLARAHLQFGEWLRRENRRLDAREHLRTAHEMYVAMGVEGFAERAARELRATGETARRRMVETAGQLTSQEAQIARFASEGLSNPEIGARLFISPRTVQYHLRKVFTKLDISSRNQLNRALAGDLDAV